MKRRREDLDSEEENIWTVNCKRENFNYDKGENYFTVKKKRKYLDSGREEQKWWKQYLNCEEKKWKFKQWREEIKI